MFNPTRPILIATLILGLAGSAAAQEAAVETTPETTTAVTETTAASSGTVAATEEGEGASTTTEPARKSSYQVREEFGNLLRRSPSELSSILLLDPTLLANQQFMAPYPALAEYVGKHPEILRNPRFFLAEFVAPTYRRSAVDEIFEGVAIFLTFGLITFAVTWIIRTIIEQKRWSRLSKQQSEVHNKILDRFGTSSELLDYVKSPAGTKFLESAPIPLHAEPPASSNFSRPMTRVIWSVQIGIIAGAAALGMILVSLRLDKESAEAMFTLGAILMSIALGFIGSAAVSLLISRRLGLWEKPQNPEDGSGRMIEPGHVR